MNKLKINNTLQKSSRGGEKSALLYLYLNDNFQSLVDSVEKALSARDFFI